jgi:hypothetical protein
MALVVDRDRVRVRGSRSLRTVRVSLSPSRSEAAASAGRCARARRRDAGAAAGPSRHPPPCKPHASGRRPRSGPSWGGGRSRSSSCEAGSAGSRPDPRRRPAAPGEDHLRHRVPPTATPRATTKVRPTTFLEVPRDRTGTPRGSRLFSYRRPRPLRRKECPG